MRLIHVGGVSGLAVSWNGGDGGPTGAKDARVYEAPRVLRPSRYMMGCRGCHLVRWSGSLDQAWTDARDHDCVPGHVCGPPPSLPALVVMRLAHAWWPYAWAAALLGTGSSALLWLWLTFRQLTGNEPGGWWNVSAVASVSGLGLLLLACWLDNLTKDTR